jgi:DnaJ-class molecular chaperone
MPFTEEILGVTANASSADVKQAYRKQCLRWHPDKNPHNIAEATEKFKQIQAAYETLLESQAADAQYDFCDAADEETYPDWYAEWCREADKLGEELLANMRQQGKTD